MRSRAPALVAVLALLIAGCSQPMPEPGVLTVAMYASPNSLDPRYSIDSLSSRAQQLMFNGLVRLDERMAPAPDLAESWESTDFQTYRMHLRSGVRFHDGHDLTSADVVYTFESILDPQSGSVLRGAFRNITSVVAVDPSTVEFVLDAPAAAFLVNLVAAKIVPAGAGRELRERPVGTGPYQFVSYAVDDRLVVKAFADYFDGLPRNRGVILRVVPDDIMRALELRKQTADLVVNDMAPDMAYQLEKEGLRLDKFAGATYQYLGFNMRDPVLQDVRVRRAIGYAIDRPSIITYLRRGLATPAAGLIPPASWAYEPGLFDFTYDPAEARRLLDEAGYVDPDGDGPAARLSLSLKVSNTEFNRLQSSVIQQNLREAGIDVDVRAYEFATLFADIQKGNFQMYTLQWAGGAAADPDILRRVFHSKQVPPSGFNRGRLSDSMLDDLLDAATAATSMDERRARYGKAQHRIAELAPYISLWYETNIAVAQPAIQGVRLTPQADFSFLRNVSR